MKIKNIPYHLFFFPTFEVYKNVKFHFRLGTVQYRTRWETADVVTIDSFIFSLFLGCFLCAEEENCVNKIMSGNVECSE